MSEKRARESRQNGQKCYHEGPYRIEPKVQPLKAQGGLFPEKWIMEISVVCAQCDEPFVFGGIPVADRPNLQRAIVRPDGIVAYLPLIPRDQSDVANRPGKIIVPGRN